MSISDKTEKWIKKNNIKKLDGKTVLITGANSGIGLKTAELALRLGGKVIMACRSREKAQKVRADLICEYPNAEIEIMTLDIADFSSIDAFAAEISKNNERIDVFINNAGVFHQPHKTTAQGFELVIGTNYFGVYYLSEKILPYLASLPNEVTYINTVSIIHKIAKTDYRDFWYNEHYNNYSAYARSKLCLAKYSCYLSKKYENTNVGIYMSHPGISLTPLGVNAYGRIVKKLSGVFGGIFNSPEKSALSPFYILSKDLPSGSIVGPTKLFGGWGYPKENRVLKKVRTGADELIYFTNGEIEKHYRNSQNP